MNPIDIISKKRDGQSLAEEEIAFLIRGFVQSDIPDYQIAAWLMAVYLRGMDERETAALTQIMAQSGERLQPHDSLPPGAFVVDKHSSGGIGDKTTLAVCPIVAACGLPVGKMSGRGLGFTGGTIDKLESIEGWSAEVSETQFGKQLREIGLVIASQTANLAPADKLIYALRDVTATVGSLPLIASSIMSKKLAAGADAILLDVKCGSGAFMDTLEEAETLARLMVSIGSRAGKAMTALVTQMDQPLGFAVGNSLEVREAIDTLHGKGPDDFQELVELISSEMLLLADPECAQKESDMYRPQVKNAIQSGAAFGKFCEFIAAQGGNVDVVEQPDKLPAAPLVCDVRTDKSGTVTQIQAAEIGMAVASLGGGRRKKEDPIDVRVGVICHAKVGDSVQAGDVLCSVHAVTQGGADHAGRRIAAAYQIEHKSCRSLPLLHSRITAA